MNLYGFVAQPCHLKTQTMRTSGKSLLVSTPKLSTTKWREVTQPVVPLQRTSSSRLSGRSSAAKRWQLWQPRRRSDGQTSTCCGRRAFCRDAPKTLSLGLALLNALSDFPVEAIRSTNI